MFITTISIKNSQLADGGNPKYTLRHGLGWGIKYPKAISRSYYQGQITQKRVIIFTFCCFCFNNVLKGMVNCQNSRDKGPPECNSARG